MKIAVDGMGGDYAPQEIIKGVELARDKYSQLTFQIFGPLDQIRPLLHSDERIELVQSDEVIAMGDEPVKAVRRKKHSSLVMAAQAVHDGSADAFLSGGNTGAILAAGLFVVGRIKGIDRPGLITTLPVVDKTKPHDRFVMLDVGANADSKIFNIYQFALMGKYYAENTLGFSKPTIGLLNNGTEADKGDKMHRAVHDLLAQNKDLNFIGNVESRELLNGAADVVVTDGFTGNAALKAMEGTALSMLNVFKSSIMSSGLLDDNGTAPLLKTTLKQLNQTLDYSKYGGAVLMGVNAPVVKMHGNTKAATACNTIGQINAMLEHQTVNKIVDYFQDHAASMKKIKEEAKK